MTRRESASRRDTFSGLKIRYAVKSVKVIKNLRQEVSTSTFGVSMGFLTQGKVSKRQNLAPLNFCKIPCVLLTAKTKTIS